MFTRLTYEEARTVVKDGDIVFVHGKWTNIISALVMFFTNSPLSHACIVFWVKTTFGPKLMCVESQGRTRRRVFPLSFYGNHLIDVIPAPKPWNLVKENALSGVGKNHYGLFEAMYVGLGEFVFRHTKRKLPVRSVNNEYCSTFVANVYGLNLEGGSPQVLYDHLVVTYNT